MKAINHESIRLSLKPGEQIIKEGDYGISIYYIVRGRVGVYKEANGKEVLLAMLGHGEVIGEMIFLNKKTEVRSASVRAIDQTELEVWHPDDLAVQYERMSPPLKYVADQALKRIHRMNKLMSRIAAKKLNRDKNKLSTWDSKRGYYRKKVDLECTYVPLHPEPETKIRLKGRIHDISMGGLGLSIDRKNLSIFPHKQGDFVFIDTVLPNGKRLKAEAVINSIKGNGKGIHFGMSFHNLSDDKFGARKTLGWYLMPA